MKFIKQFIKRYNFLYVLLKPCVIFLRKCLDFTLRNRSLMTIKKSSNNYKNIFILDNRLLGIQFDSILLLIRGSNFFYKDKWDIIIYEDDFYRYSTLNTSKEVYSNNLVNIFFQFLLILPNPPTSIKFIKNIHELLKIIRKSNKIFPEDYNYLTNNNAYLYKDFNEKDFQNFKINQPVLKASKYHSDIFDDYLNYRNIKKYITITIRTKKSRIKNSNSSWDTNLDDVKLYLDYIKENNLSNHKILLIPDPNQDVPKKIINLINENNLQFEIFHHGSFSIPLRFLAYSKADFNFASSNGPAVILFFIESSSLYILKDPWQGEDVQKFGHKINKDLFLNKKLIFKKSKLYYETIKKNNIKT